MGAKIEGVGSATLTIQGVEPGALDGRSRTASVPDRVEAATFLRRGGGHRRRGRDLRNARADHMDDVPAQARRHGRRTSSRRATGSRRVARRRLRSVDVATLPYPGVATDYKPLLTAMLSVADGVGIVTENLFTGRFRYVDELVRMGADIRTDDHHAVVRGVARLSGAPGAGPRHPGRRRAGGGRPGRRGRDRDHRRRTTSTAATTTSSASCGCADRAPDVAPPA